MVDQWNFTIQQQLSNSLTFQIGYVGQRGAHLLNFEDVAQSVPLDAAGHVAGAGRSDRHSGSRTVPGWRNAWVAVSGGQSTIQRLRVAGHAGNPACFGAETLAGANMSNSDQKYDALQAVLQKRMSNGLEGQVSYTWSKCMSNSPGYFGTGWGSTERHQFGRAAGLGERSTTRV